MTRFAKGNVPLPVTRSRHALARCENLARPWIIPRLQSFSPYAFRTPPSSRRHGRHGRGALPGTQPLTVDGDLSVQMVDGINRWLARETEVARTERTERWSKAAGKGWEPFAKGQREKLRQPSGWWTSARRARLRWCSL